MLKFQKLGSDVNFVILITVDSVFVKWPLYVAVWSGFIFIFEYFIYFQILYTESPRLTSASAQL
jgi:hypothetical protein